MEKIKTLIENFQKNLVAVISAIAALIAATTILITSVEKDTKALKAGKISTNSNTNEIVTNK
jgi:hypothetical protein